MLNANTINGGLPTYQWFVNGIPVAGANSSAFTFVVTPPDTMVSVGISSSLSCVTSHTAFDTTSIHILQNLPSSVTISQSPAGLVCAGDTIIYSAHSQYGGPAPQFLWFVNGIATTTTDSVFVFTPGSNDSISVRMTSSLSCVSNANVDNFSIAAISPSVSPNVSLKASPSNVICQGNTITFTATAQNSGSSPTFSWFVNGISAGMNDSIFVSSTINNNDVVKVIVQSSLTCCPHARATRS